jgi:hypothetical protein
MLLLSVVILKIQFLQLFTTVSGFVTDSLSNCTTKKFRIPIQSTLTRTIYEFNCFSFQQKNPTFPKLKNSLLVEYTEIDLSPNVFTEIPIVQICEFKYIDLLDLSSNQITNLNGAFVHLKCLRFLNKIDLSNNQIDTPLLAADFDDNFAAQIQSLNLSSNRIKFIETLTFLKKEGSTRFPNLKYLNIENNLIKEFDLLWPLTLPSSSLIITLKQNPIDTLFNQNNKSFDDPIFNNPMIGNRFVDLVDNKLQFLDDSNLLQYGLKSPNDLKEFLRNISNYDMRQSNFVPTFQCYCSNGSIEHQVVTWFRSFSQGFKSESPIYKLYCSNIANRSFILDYKCQVN